MSENKSAPGGPRRYGPALEKGYQFVLWLIPTVEKFPRTQKFLLGDRLQTTALDMLEALIEATYSREVVPILRRVNLMLERLRVLFRLAKDLRYIDFPKYEFTARAVDEIGRMVGGWMKGARTEGPAS
ncbi:MAG: diversity-generating retroelement protein Avd [Burkholderiales bacterium]|jgi:hypothetical protein|nr:diversity-generating retroelement protein Avd [Burkholderiales bacterium]